jgi:uracil-DNA glycosylase
MDKFVKRIPSTKKAAKKASAFPDFQTFISGLGTWKSKLSGATSSKTFANCYAFVQDKYESEVCYPPTHQIFNAFSTTPIEEVKVVIVGQDPYHQPGQAMGLCFSINKGIKIPPSLRNIYKCINQDEDVPDFKIPKHGDLTNWANQGVFLLNTVLTVTDSSANSHKKAGWLKFTDEVIRVISKECEGVVFMLWGKPAQKKASLIDADKHHILNAAHPSPLSAFRGFFTCQHFSKANALLEADGKDTIDWNKINEKVVENEEEEEEEE